MRWGGSGAALMAAQRDTYQIPHATACRALGVSRSWFCKHQDRGLTARQGRREVLAAEICRLFRAHRGTYGSPPACARPGGRSARTPLRP